MNTHHEKHSSEESENEPSTGESIVVKKKTDKPDNGIRKRQVESASSQANKTDKTSSEQKRKPEAIIKRKQSAFMFLLADFMHNFIDGIALGVAFAYSTRVGISTLIAEFFHELPHEIGDFAVLVKKGYSISAVLITQLFTAFGALIGGLIGIYVGAIADYLIGFTAGGFLYLALSNMVPEILDLTKGKNVFDIILEMGSMTFGMYLMYLIAISE